MPAQITAHASNCPSSFGPTPARGGSTTPEPPSGPTPARGNSTTPFSPTWVPNAAAPGRTLHVAYFTSAGGNSKCSMTRTGDGVYYADLGVNLGEEDNGHCNEMTAPYDGWSSVNSKLEDHYYFALGWDPKTNLTTSLSMFCHSSDCSTCDVQLATVGPAVMHTCMNGIEASNSSAFATSYFLLEPESHSGGPGHNFCVLAQETTDSTALFTEMR